MSKTFIAAIDFSPSSSRVTETAADFAGLFAAELHLLHVAAPEPEFIGYEPGPKTVRDDIARDLRKEHQELQALAEKLASRGLHVRPVMVQGAPIEVILNHADRAKADLVIMGSHGHGMVYELLVGSVTGGVLRASTCPVLVVPASRPSQ